MHYYTNKRSVGHIRHFQTGIDIQPQTMPYGAEAEYLIVESIYIFNCVKFTRIF